MEFKQIKKKDIELSQWNPRSKHDEEKLAELSQSIKGVGLIEPMVVRPSSKKGKYLLTAGRGRYDSFKDNDLIDCVIRAEGELDAKITSLIENYVRENVSDEDHEKFIAGIYEEGCIKGKWSNETGMSKATGIPQVKIGNCIRGLKVRADLELSPVLKITTRDIDDTVPLAEQPKLRKRLLEERGKKGRDLLRDGERLRDMATTLSKIPEPVAQAVLNEKIEYDDVKTRVDMLGRKQMPIEVAEDLVKKLADEKTQIKISKKLSAEMDTISIKEGEPADRQVKVVKNVDASRLEIWEKRWRQFELMTVHDINVITNQKDRSRAVQYLKMIREKCSALLVQLGEEKLIDLKKKK